MIRQGLQSHRMPDKDPITYWIGELQGGNRDAAQRLWEHYFQRLVALAESKLRGRRRAVVDEEDLAVKRGQQRVSRY